jgi:hypothetical protein
MDRSEPELQAAPAADAASARHGSVNFSFFHYRPRFAPLAFVLMGFQGLVRGQELPPGDVRLLGCGGKDGFSIKPDFTRYCLYHALDDPAAEPRLRATRLWRLVAGPSIETLHFRLRPASGHGTWDGAEPFAYSGNKVGERPFVVLTHARVNRGKAPAFWRSVPAVRRDLREAAGCAYQIGFGEHPLLTLATFSVWNDLASMRAFAYGNTAHRDTNRAARTDGWLSESLFARFEIERLGGDLAAYPTLAALAEAGRIPR